MAVYSEEAPESDLWRRALEELEEPRGVGLPGVVDPGLLPPLCDANTEAAVFSWHRLIFDEESPNDLSLELCGEREIGEPPEWAEQFDGILRLDNVYDPPRILIESEEPRVTFTDQWITWALEEGLAPGQPFLVSIQTPRGYRSGYYGEEWDEEFRVDVVRRLSWPAERALSTWTLALDEIAKYRRSRVEQYREHWIRQETDTKALGLEAATGTGPGVTVTLTTKHVHVDDGAPDRFRGPTGMIHQHRWSVPLESAFALDFPTAFRELLKKIRENRPRVDLLAVLGLAAGRARFSRWEHLNLALV